MSISVVVISYGRRPCRITNMHLQSLAEKQYGLIDEVVIVHNREKEYYEIEEKYKGIKLIHIGRPPLDAMKFYSRTVACTEGIKYATNNYILTTDPDIIYAKKHFDKFYIDLYEKHDLNLIGVSHFLKASYGSTFPCMINMILRKDRLPDAEWMKGKLITSGRYLDGNPMCEKRIEERSEEYPNPCVSIWDQGGNIYLWNKDIGGKYITFMQDKSGSIYGVNRVYANFEIDKSQFKDEVLLCHARNSFNPHTVKEMNGWLLKYADKKKHKLL